MKVEVYMFGIAKEIFGSRSVEIVWEKSDTITAAELKLLLEDQKPALKAIGSYLVAVNNDYALNGFVIREKDEVAIIPPVSGG